MSRRLTPSSPPQIAELEKRLAQLEATVRCEPESQVRGQGLLPCHSPAPHPAPLMQFPSPQHPLSVGLKGTSLMVSQAGAGGHAGSLSPHPVPRALGRGSPRVLPCPPSPCSPSPGDPAARAGQGQRPGRGRAGPSGGPAAGEGGTEGGNGTLGVTGPRESQGTALAEAVKLGVGTAGFGVSHLLPPPQSVLAKVNEIAKHKATVQDADTQSKVRAGGEGPPKAVPAWQDIWTPPLLVPPRPPDPPDL